MSKFIKLTDAQWNKILEKIKKSHSPSVYLISYKMRDVLGFTVRRHEIDWRTSTIHLDFYDEKKRTMFLLKYSEHISSND